jgi:hypothetical protein
MQEVMTNRVAIMTFKDGSLPDLFIYSEADKNGRMVYEKS